MITLWIWITLVVIWLLPIAYKLFLTRSDVALGFYNNARPRTLFVHLPGMNGGGYTQIVNVIMAFVSRGHLITVHYDGKLGKKATKFDPDLVVRETYERILKEHGRYTYERIVFVGTSMGGALALRIADKLYQNGIKSSAILIDAPLTAKDLVGRKGVPLLRALPFLPFFNWLLVIPRLFTTVFASPPKENEIDELTYGERRELDESVKQARKTPPAFIRDQIVSIQDPRIVYQPWDYSQVVFIRSTDDTEVTLQEAYESWAEKLGFKPMYVSARGAKHCAYGQQPRRYYDEETGVGALQEAFAFLGV